MFSLCDLPDLASDSQCTAIAQPPPSTVGVLVSLAAAVVSTSCWKHSCSETFRIVPLLALFILANTMPSYPDGKAVKVIQGVLRCWRTALVNIDGTKYSLLSPKVAQDSQSAAAKFLTPIVLELGGKNALLFLIPVIFFGTESPFEGLEKVGLEGTMESSPLIHSAMKTV
uniref:Uncharacterized protein n=1 Tax=Cannabis sativa TaxID=3483 RepID=A0A803QRU1_CANSA